MNRLKRKKWKLLILITLSISTAQAESIDVSKNPKDYENYLKGLSNAALTSEAIGQETKILVSCAVGAGTVGVNAVLETIPFLSAIPNCAQYEVGDSPIVSRSMNTIFGTPATVAGEAIGETAGNIYQSFSGFSTKPLSDYSGTAAVKEDIGYISTRETYHDRFENESSTCLQSQKKIEMIRAEKRARDSAPQEQAVNQAQSPATSSVTISDSVTKTVSHGEAL